MTILITGGAGFIGTNLIKKLLAKRKKIICLDNFYSSDKKNVQEFLANKNFKLVEHDVIKKIPKQFDEFEIKEIYHLACPASPRHYQKDPLFTLDTCYLGTCNILDFALRNGKIPVLFTSTSEIYGDSLEHPQVEEYRGNVNPHGIRSCYDEGKRVAESLCMNYFRKYNLPVKIVRVFNTYGPKMDPEDGRVVSNFIVQALRGKSLTIYGDGKQTRSFQYIDDLISGLVSFMELKENFPGPINLGNPDEFSIIDLAQKLNEIFLKKLKFEYKDLPEDDPAMRCPDISLARKKLNFSPKTDLATGLKRTIEYFSKL